jgi:hypothetical protein
VTDFERRLVAANLDLHKAMKHAHGTIKDLIGLGLLSDGTARNVLEAESHLMLEAMLGAMAVVTEGDLPD